MTSRKDWDPSKILTSFLSRWPTETFNEDAKQHLGLEDYQLRKMVGIKRCWYLAFVAYSLLRLDAEPSRLLKVVTAGVRNYRSTLSRHGTGNGVDLGALGLPASPGREERDTNSKHVGRVIIWLRFFGQGLG